MNTIRNLLHNKEGKAIVGVVALLALVLFAGTTVVAAEKAKDVDEQRDQSTITTGSGERYQTTVERRTEGKLSAQDLHQVSLLTSRIVNHVNEGVKGLLDQDPDAAKPEIEKAQALTKVVRELLPVTTVTTVVKDAKGKEVYRDIDKVQDDRIPLYRGMIAMEVVEPIVDAKEEDAALKGLRLADANVIHTSVLADLSYIERKLNRAAVLLDKPEDALAQLALAQTRGIELVVNEADDPLVKVQHALRLAERMVEEGKHEAARDNLRLAQIHLGTYRALLGKEVAKGVQKLEDDIAALMPKTEEKGAAEKIREFWERAVSWFREEPGQAHVVEEGEGEQAEQPRKK
ncbi:MAG: YfdX family protein [Sedimentisphaerales bacterium]|nr:YfdX family protein [Sedimentisphaerales bacterium]